MGNSPKKPTVEKSKYVSSEDKCSQINTIRCPLNNYGEKVVDIDCISLNDKESLLSVLTKQNIIFETFNVFTKRKKQKKLDIKTLFAIDFMADNDGQNVIIHPKMKNIIAVSFNSNISIYQINIENKSYQLLLKLLIENKMESIQNNMYFLNENQIIYTSLNGNIFIYDFMQKQLINTIKLSSIVKTLKEINCIDFGLDLNTNPNLYCIFAKKLNSKVIDKELVYLLNITNCIQSKKGNNHGILSLLNSETNKFESVHNDQSKQKQKQKQCGLRIFKQIQCVAFSPNMEFLAIACGSSIDLFYYQQKMCSDKKEFVYITYHNYGGFVQNMEWMNDNILIIITNNKSNPLIITQIKLNKQEHIINIIIDIFKELGLTDDIIDVMFAFLDEWIIKHQSIPFYGGVDIKNRSLLKSCIHTNNGRGAIVIGGQLYPELIVSVVD